VSIGRVSTRSWGLRTIFPHMLLAADMPTLLRRILPLLCAVLAGCGGAGSDRPNREATLLLDFTPNGVHAGIYLATARGYDDAEGVQLEVRAPSASTDALRLLQGGRADMAILDIHDLGLARQEGADIVGVMALVQLPLAAVLAQPEIARPRDLEGRRAGVTGLPSDVAVLRSVVAGDGGDPDRVRTTTIGFEAVKALLAGRVAGATAFWNVEGVALKAERPDTQEFRVDDFGAPAYPELVLCVTRRALEDDRSVIAATIRALQRGYTQAQADPESAVTALLDAESGLDRESAQAQLDAVGPAFTAGARAYGELREEVLREWAAWDVEFGILDERPDVDRAFDLTLVGPVSNP
jgi:putative hydroxymethylpyrimidine transport system substrate-binding protein